MNCEARIDITRNVISDHIFFAGICFAGLVLRVSTSSYPQGQNQYRYTRVQAITLKKIIFTRHIFD